MKQIKKMLILSCLSINLVAICFPELKITKIEGNIAWVEDKNGKKYSGKIIDTRSNRVGINDNESCAVIEPLQENGKNYPLRIVCKSGRQFNNVGFFIGSATGTPPHLEYSNYIGQLSHDQTTFGLKQDKKDEKPGEARRTIYCDGPCLKK